MRMLNNFKPETRSLINRLTKAGFTIVSGNNGEESFKFTGDVDAFLSELLACDEATLRVIAPGTPFKTNPETGKSFQPKLTLFLVLGNSPGELVCDYTVHPLLDEVTEAHASEWDGKPQPKISEDEAYPHLAALRLEREAHHTKQAAMAQLFVENLND